MKHLFIFLSLTIFLGFYSFTSVSAEPNFEDYLSDFYQKQEKASRLLKEIETSLRNGSRSGVCAKQREAAILGIEATNSLIEAFKISDSKTDTRNLQAGLDKWRELRDYC